MSKTRIKAIIFEADGREYTGELVSEAQMKAAKVPFPCEYGDTVCVDHRLWRCVEIEFPFRPNTYIWVNTGQPC